MKRLAGIILHYENGDAVQLRDDKPTIGHPNMCRIIAYYEKAIW